MLLGVLARDSVFDQVLDPELVGQLLLHVPLALARRLPDLGQRVPGVVDVDRGAAAGDAGEQVGADRGDALDQQRAPVVADQVDAAAEPLQLLDDPIDVGLLGAGEAVGGGRGEAGQVGGDDLALVGAELLDHAAPESRGVGVSVHEECGHAPLGLALCARRLAAGL